MNSTASPKGPAPCPRCAPLLPILYKDVKDIKALMELVHRFILQKETEETIYRDAVYAMDRVGISESTLLRCQHRGLIRVAKLERGKKFFHNQDVERLRTQYWGK